MHTSTPLPSLTIMQAFQLVMFIFPSHTSLSGEEEEQYWHKVIDGSGGGKERRGGRGGRRGRGGRGRGGRGRGGRGRSIGSARKRRDRSSAGEGEGHPPESKVQKTAED